MAKYKYGETPEKQKKWRKEGRGLGRGAEYRPWLTVHDVASLGNIHRVDGIKILRDHHLLSDPERDYFYILEFCDFVIDIREQYPLFELEETQAIAQEIGVDHPIDPHTNCPKMITTDFLVTTKKDGIFKELARTVKKYDHLMDQREMEKFEIERRYWKQKDVDWGIVTEREIDSTMAINLGHLRASYDLSKLEGYKELSEKSKKVVIAQFTKAICGSDIVIRDTAFAFDQKMSLPIGTALSLFKHLAFNKVILINLEKELDFDSPQNICIQQAAAHEVLVG